MTPKTARIFFSLASLPVAAGTLARAAVAAPGGSALSALSDGQAQGAWVFHHENVMGTSLEVTLRARSRGQAEVAEAALLRAIEWHEAILSAWRKDSELSRWMATRGEAKPVSAELLEVLGLFDGWRERTGGALDASTESAARLWRKAAGEGRRPTEFEIATTVEAMQQPHWRLDAAGGTAMRLSDTPLALASFTKSYVAGRAADVALAAGASGVMLNVGGDIVVRGDLTQVVDVADPRADSENDRGIDRVVVRNLAVATSGGYRRGVEIAGDGKLSHLIDPRTALPVGHMLSSTVIAKDPATAGALATAFSVMGFEESRALAEKVGGVEYLLVTADGARVESAGWQRLQLPELRTVGYAAPQAKRLVAADASWNQGLELVIDLELARIDEPRYHRPYVAVWVEDQDHKPVRTIALWYNKARYLPDLKNWYRDDQTRMAAGAGDITSTVSSATRSPGRYSLKWDGKDNEGKLVKPGRYTICVESAREHGGAEFLHQEMDFSGKPAQHTFAAGIEMGTVTLDYRKP